MKEESTDRPSNGCIFLAAVIVIIFSYYTMQNTNPKSRNIRTLLWILETKSRTQTVTNARGPKCKTFKTPAFQMYCSITRFGKKGILLSAFLLLTDADHNRVFCNANAQHGFAQYTP